MVQKCISPVFPLLQLLPSTVNSVSGFVADPRSVNDLISSRARRSDIIFK